MFPVACKKQFVWLMFFVCSECLSGVIYFLQSSNTHLAWWLSAYALRYQLNVHRQGWAGLGRRQIGDQNNKIGWDLRFPCLDPAFVVRCSMLMMAKPSSYTID